MRKNPLFICQNLVGFVFSVIFFTVPNLAYSNQLTFGATVHAGYFSESDNLFDQSLGGALDIGYRLSPNWGVDVLYSSTGLRSQDLFRRQYEYTFGVPEENGYSRKSINLGLTHFFEGNSFVPFIRGSIGLSKYYYKHDFDSLVTSGTCLTCVLKGGGLKRISNKLRLKFGVEVANDSGAEKNIYSVQGFLGLEFIIFFEN